MTPAMLFLFLTDTTSVNIRALVAKDMDRAAFHSDSVQNLAVVHHPFGLSDMVLITELSVILMMAILFVLLIVHFRKVSKEQRQKITNEHIAEMSRQQVISKAEIERILEQITAEKNKTAGNLPENVYVTRDGRLDSRAAIHEIARTHGLESERLNFAISYASRAANKNGSRFKEAFAMVDEGTDLNVLARQLNMGKGELELILALKKTKIANSRRPTGLKGESSR